MVTYGKDMVKEVETKTDFDKIGNVTMDQMDTIPFLQVYFYGNVQHKNGINHKQCFETGSDYIAFVEKYFQIKWIN